jgi:hypothetical protein
MEMGEGGLVFLFFNIVGFWVWIKGDGCKKKIKLVGVGCG